LLQADLSITTIKHISMIKKGARPNFKFGFDLHSDKFAFRKVMPFRRIWPALAALFVSHAFSFKMNSLGRKEYRGRSLNDQMSESYRRIIFMHIVLIVGGGLTMVLGSPALILPAIIALKTYFDVKAHMKQHANIKTRDKK
jgi:hypothetical protein